jgi:hypothetical protein
MGAFFRPPAIFLIRFPILLRTLLGTAELILVTVETP